jgi:hypothetical protein
MKITSILAFVLSYEDEGCALSWSCRCAILSFKCHAQVQATLEGPGLLINKSRGPCESWGREWFFDLCPEVLLESLSQSVSWCQRNSLSEGVLLSLHRIHCPELRTTAKIERFFFRNSFKVRIEIFLLRISRLGAGPNFSLSITYV